MQQKLHQQCYTRTTARDGSAAAKCTNARLHFKVENTNLGVLTSILISRAVARRMAGEIEDADF